MLTDSPSTSDADQERESPTLTPQQMLANDTVKRIRSALDNGKAAGVPEIIQLIQQLSSKAFSISIKELAELIGKDVTVTAKVISAANTVGFNPSGVPVNTISQAIHVIGFDRIRNLAISLMLMENAERSLAPEEQRENAAIALSSGLVAKGLMNETKTIDPELAFVCASLRNYGRLLMSTFLVDDYRKASSLALEKPKDEAFRDVFGLTPLELGHQLLVSAHLPKTILRSLEKVPQDLINRAAQSPEEKLLLISEFSVNLVELATDPTCDAEAFEQRAASLSRKFQHTVRVDIKQIMSVFKEAEHDLRMFGRTYGLRCVSNHVLRSVGARAAGKAPPKRVTVEVTQAASSGASRSVAAASKGISASDSLSRDWLKDTEPAPRQPGGAATTPAPHEAPASGAQSNPLLKGIASLADLLANPNLQMKVVYEVACQALHEGLSLSDCVVFHAKAENYAAVLGHGAFFEEVRGRNLVRRDRRDVFGVSLARREDVLIENAEEPKIQPYIPEWLRVEPPMTSFVILPICEGDRPFALLMGGRRGRKPIVLGAEVLQQLRALRIHIVTAYRRRVSAA